MVDRLFGLMNAERFIRFIARNTRFHNHNVLMETQPLVQYIKQISRGIFFEATWHVHICYDSQKSPLPASQLADSRALVRQEYKQFSRGIFHKTAWQIHTCYDSRKCQLRESQHFDKKPAVCKHSGKAKNSFLSYFPLSSMADQKLWRKATNRISRIKRVWLANNSRGR